jgi:hypothetical protein
MYLAGTRSRFPHPLGSSYSKLLKTDPVIATVPATCVALSIQMKRMEERQDLQYVPTSEHGDRGGGNKPIIRR